MVSGRIIDKSNTQRKRYTHKSNKNTFKSTKKNMSSNYSNLYCSCCCLLAVFAVVFGCGCVENVIIFMLMNLIICCLIFKFTSLSLVIHFIILNIQELENQRFCFNFHKSERDGKREWVCDGNLFLLLRMSNTPMNRLARHVHYCVVLCHILILCSGFFQLNSIFFM